MARRAIQLKPSLFFAGAAAFVVAALCAGTLGAVMVRADGLPRLGPADWAAIRFTVLQASLSSLFSVLLAIPIARALARRRFPGRRALITLLGAPFILPVIVAVLGLLAVFGRSGLLNSALTSLGLPPVSIYGLHGVVLAHVFFNLPLAVRFLLQGWLAIPAERFRLAASLGMGSAEIRRLLERPMLLQVVPGALMVIFLICLTSFAVALTLGGGPRATTVELAIYQAFRLEFDLGRAALLALCQLGLTVAAASLAIWLGRPPGFGGGLDRVVDRWDAATRATRSLDGLAISLAAGFLILPLLMIVVNGLPGLLSLSRPVLEATLVSLIVALASVVLTLLLALPLAVGAAATRGITRGGIEALGYLGIAASPLVLGTGLFILVFPIADPARLALPVTALVNAILALPFALRILAPAAQAVEDAHGRLADSLGLRGWVRLRWLILPRLAGPLGFSAGLAAALSMGDLGVIALFANTETATLPLQIYRLMAAYRMEDAAAGSLLLLALSLGLFWLFDRGGRGFARA